MQQEFKNTWLDTRQTVMVFIMRQEYNYLYHLQKRTGVPSVGTQRCPEPV